MSATAIGLIVFALVFGSALLAMYVGDALPEHHLPLECRDGAQHREDQLAIDAARIEVAEIEDFDFGALGLRPHHDIEQVPRF